MTPKNVREFFKRFQAQNAHPQGELKYKNAYTLLVAVVLSAQATDKSVNLATEKLFKAASSPKTMLALGEDGLKGYIKTIGLYNSKAKNIIKLSQQLMDNHSGKVPDKLEDLVKLAGVGRKTANVVLNIAFGKPVMAVDTHVFRVANRTGLASGETVEEVEEKLLKTVPEEFKLNAHHWLLLHGRYVCTARTPKCADCIVRDLCAFNGKNL